MNKKRNYLYQEITDKIWKILPRLLNDFRRRPGYSEHKKKAALVNLLKGQELAVATEVPIIHRYKGTRIGVGFIDLVLDSRVVVEVKNVDELTAEHMDQLKRYVEDGGFALGVLINLGDRSADIATTEGRKMIFQRYYYAPNDPYRE